MSDSLEHYGVKGMKWGVRRYQNADGTLTEAGKKKQEKLQRRAIRDINRNFSKHPGWPRKDHKRAIKYIMGMSLRQLELRTMNSFERTKLERKEMSKAGKNAIKSEALRNKGMREEADKYMKKAQDIIDYTLAPSMANISWNDVEKQKMYYEILESYRK